MRQLVPPPTQREAIEALNKMLSHQLYGAAHLNPGTDSCVVIWEDMTKTYSKIADLYHDHCRDGAPILCESAWGNDIEAYISYDAPSNTYGYETITVAGGIVTSQFSSIPGSSEFHLTVLDYFGEPSVAIPEQQQYKLTCVCPMHGADGILARGCTCGGN